MKVLVFIGISLTALFAGAKLYGINDLSWPWIMTPLWIGGVAYLIHVFSSNGGYDDDLGD